MNLPIFPKAGFPPQLLPYKCRLFPFMSPPFLRLKSGVLASFSELSNESTPEDLLNSEELPARLYTSQILRRLALTPKEEYTFLDTICNYLAKKFPGITYVIPENKRDIRVHFNSAKNRAHMVKTLEEEPLELEMGPMLVPVAAFEWGVGVPSRYKIHAYIPSVLHPKQFLEAALREFQVKEIEFGNISGSMARTGKVTLWCAFPDLETAYQVPAVLNIEGVEVKLKHRGCIVCAQCRKKGHYAKEHIDSNNQHCKAQTEMKHYQRLWNRIIDGIPVEEAIRHSDSEEEALRVNKIERELILSLHDELSERRQAAGL